MTQAQLEERLTALEKAFEEMRLQTTPAATENGVNDEKNTPSVEEDDFIPGVEYDLVVNVPPEETIYFRARIVSIETPPAGLGLSDAEWALYGSEDENE